MADRKEKIKKILMEGSKQQLSGNKKEYIIIGNNNIAGEQITVIKTEETIIKPKVEVKPGEGVITDQQAAVVRGLVAEIVELEKKLKKKPKTYAQVYGALFRHLSKNKKYPEITSYRLIPKEKFEKAEKFLRTWIGRLTSLKSAPKKDSSWRKRKYAYIHTNIKKLGLEKELREHLKTRFGVNSLKDLSDDELQKVYNTVAYWKRKFGG